LKIDKLLAVTLALVLIAGFVSPAFSDDPKNKNHGLPSENSIYLPAVAPDHVEVGDAGESINTAQDPGGNGALNTITGSLIDLGTLSEIDDIDIFSLCILTPIEFSVLTDANLSEDNDAQLFLFDSTGSLVVEDDDDGVGFLPQINAGELTTLPGVYYLAINLFNTDPTFTNNILDGWDRGPSPFQTGPYTLTLTSTEAASSASCQVVGGEFLPIDSTALLLAGAQSFSWMIPVVLSGIGIGLFVASRKSE